MSLHDEMLNILGERCVFGMDIGTSSCYMAYKESPNTPPKIPNYRGACIGGIPSLIMRDKKGNEWIADEVADRNGMLDDPCGVCSSIKMKLAEERIELNGHSYTPRELAVKLVKRVVDISREAMMQEMVAMAPKEIVCGIPVRFKAAERGEMMSIINEAMGTDVKVRLVPEPILAALTNDYYLKRTQHTSRKVLVIDMGAGTLDVVLLEPNENPNSMNPYPYIAKQPDGSREAGDKLDEIMENLILDKIRETPGTVDMKSLENKNHYDRRKLSSTAKETKERLSQQEQSTVQFSGISGGSTIVFVSKKEYEERITPVIKRTVDLAFDVLKRCNLGSNPDIDILLVGGSTYIPLLRTMLKKRFKWLKDENIMQRFPERAVAMGAAIYAEQPSLVLPKIAYGYAVNTYIVGDNEEKLNVVIPSGAVLPMTVRSNFRTLNSNQTCIIFDVYEVERGTDGQILEMDKGNITKYTFKHEFGKQVVKGTPIVLETTLTADGILTMCTEDFQSPKNTAKKTFSLNAAVI